MNSVKSMIWVQTPHPVIWHQHQAWLQVWNQSEIYMHVWSAPNIVLIDLKQDVNS